MHSGISALRTITNRGMLRLLQANQALGTEHLTERRVAETLFLNGGNVLLVKNGHRSGASARLRADLPGLASAVLTPGLRGRFPPARDSHLVLCALSFALSQRARRRAPDCHSLRRCCSAWWFRRSSIARYDVDFRVQKSLKAKSGAKRICWLAFFLALTVAVLLGAYSL